MEFMLSQNKTVRKAAGEKKNHYSLLLSVRKINLSLWGGTGELCTLSVLIRGIKPPLSAQYIPSPYLEAVGSQLEPWQHLDINRKVWKSQHRFQVQVHPKPEPIQGWGALKCRQPFPACIQSSFSLFVAPSHVLLSFISTSCLHIFFPSFSHVFYRRESFQFSWTGTAALAIRAGHQHQSTFYWVSLIFIRCKTANVDFRLTCWIAFLMCTAGARYICSGCCTCWYTPTSVMEMNKCVCGPCN